MRKTTYLIGFILILLITACGQTIQYPESDEDVFVQLRLYSASEGTYLDFFPQKIGVANDGGVRIFTEDIVNTYGDVELNTSGAPIYEGQITDEDVEGIKRIIEKNKFLSMPENVTDYRVMDGSGRELTVYFKDGEKSVRGDNSDNEKFMEITNRIFDLVRDEYKEWYEETRAYLAELNDMEDE